MTLAVLVKPPGSGGPAEYFQAAKGETGLDQYQVVTLGEVRRL